MKSDEDFNYIRDAILCQNFHSLGLLFGIKPSFISTINNSNNTDGKSAKLREQMETLNTTLIPKPELEEAVLYLPSHLLPPTMRGRATKKKTMYLSLHPFPA